MKIEMRNVSDLIPYQNNLRNNEAAVEPVMKSIKEFGFRVPIIIDKDHTIIAGHTRLKAAKKLKLTEVPCVIADDLSEQQIKAFRLADNKVAEMSDWDLILLDKELDDIFEFDMEDFGFILDDFDEEENNPYTSEINIPQYKITGEIYAVNALYDTEKSNRLKADIELANISDEEKAFLLRASERHNVFNYKRIAEYYAGASEEMQRLMEQSALVIIDFDDAIKNGYVKLSSAVEGMLNEGQ